MDAPATQDKGLRMSYRIRRGEQGVLTFEPYKSALLPLWRFKTVAIARKSSSDLWEKFVWYGEQGDFVGMDMARKFVQMVGLRSYNSAFQVALPGCGCAQFFLALAHPIMEPSSEAIKFRG